MDPRSAWKNLQPILFFDGVCNLCNRTIIFVLNHEKGDHLYFAPLQSQSGEAILEFLNDHHDDADSLVLYDNDRLYIKSRAAFQLATYFRWPYNLLQHLNIFPQFFTDYCYDFVARNRYRFFGRREECMIPSPGISSRFLT